MSDNPSQATAMFLHPPLIGPAGTSDPITGSEMGCAIEMASQTG